MTARCVLDDHDDESDDAHITQKPMALFKAVGLVVVALLAGYAHNRIPEVRSFVSVARQAALGPERPPFHLAFPVHDLQVAKKFYGGVLGLSEGRSSAKWQDYSLEGHQIVAHWVGEDYKGADFFNPVDGDEVPVPHFGLALSETKFHELADRLNSHNVKFIIEPHLRFKGEPGEQWTMFFKDPSGNNLEFKAMTNPENLFAKYHVE